MQTSTTSVVIADPFCFLVAGWCVTPRLPNVSRPYHEISNAERASADGDHPRIAPIFSVMHHVDASPDSLHSAKVDGRRMQPWWFHESSFAVAIFKTDTGEDRHCEFCLSSSKLATLDTSCEASREAFRLACSFAAAYEDFLEPGPKRGRPARG